MEYGIITSGKNTRKSTNDTVGFIYSYPVPVRGDIRKRGRILGQQWLPAIRIIQIILSVAVIIFILLQARGAGLGSVFGGSSAGSVFKTRRGVERLIFNLTIVFVILFVAVSLLSSFLH
jgi:preprotein translocase subunit SecG